MEWIGILVTFYQNLLCLFNATTNKTALLKGEKSRINAGRKGINQKLYVCMVVCSQSCQTVCDPMEYSLPGSSVHGIISARILEWVAIFSFRGSSWPRDQTCVSCIFSTGRWMCQAPLSFTISQSLLKFMSTQSVMSSNQLLLCHPPSSCLQYFPTSGKDEIHTKKMRLT